jgi:hydroxypyruvate reductase
MPTGTSPARILRALFDAAVASAQPAVCLPAHLPTPPKGKTVVVGAGKASAAMAQALEAHWPAPLTGIVIVPYGSALPCQHIDVVEAAHPVPDAKGQAATRQLFDAVRGLGADDLVICLISGGGSALLAMPASGITLAEKQQVNAALLKSGATIAEMNCVRKHLSASKGGQLALACQPARVVTLAISDVPGDDPTVIASGPTVPDPTSCADALAILQRYGIGVSPQAQRWLTAGRGETPKLGDPRFIHHDYRLIATPQMALTAAAQHAASLGLPAHILSDRMEGEARDIAKAHAAIALQIADRSQPFASPCILLSGGETTVTVKGTGRGGRNSEFLLAMALALDGHPRIHALAADTDGIDGSERNAGALLGPDTLARGRQRGLSALQHLANNDAYSYFEVLGDLLVTGPTHTNVNDFRALLLV